MPKYFCEYCGIYLTHSSPGGRLQHVHGRKHISNKIEYYSQFLYEFKQNFVENPLFLAGKQLGQNIHFGMNNIIIPQPQNQILMQPPVPQPPNQILIQPPIPQIQNEILMNNININNNPSKIEQHSDIMNQGNIDNNISNINHIGEGDKLPEIHEDITEENNDEMTEENNEDLKK